MKWKTRCALGDPATLDFVTTPFEAVAAAHALIVGGRWERMDDGLRQRLIDIAARSDDARLGMLWMIGSHDRLLAAALASPDAVADYQATLAARGGAAPDPMHQALLAPDRHLPVDDDSVRRLVAMAEAEPACTPTIAVRLAQSLQGRPRSAWIGWNDVLRIAAREPLLAARTFIALHRAGLADSPSIADDLPVFEGAVSRLPEAMLECCAAGRIAPIWGAQIAAAGKLSDAAARFVAAWNDMTPDQRALAHAWCARDPAAAATLARATGADQTLADTICAHGDASDVMTYLANITPPPKPTEHLTAVVGDARVELVGLQDFLADIAPGNRTTAHMAAVVNAAREVPIAAVELVGLHPRIVYQGLRDPASAAMVIAAFRRSPHFDPDHPALAGLRQRACADPSAAVDVIQAMGPTPETVAAALTARDVLPRLIAAIARHGAAPPDDVRRAAEALIDDPTAPPTLRAHTAAATLAWQESPPPNALTVAAGDPSAALTAIKAIADWRRWETLPPAARQSLIDAAVRDPEAVVQVVALVGDSCAAWDANERIAEAMAQEQTIPLLRAQAITGRRIAYLNALVGGGTWESLDDERRRAILQACTEHTDGIEPSIRLVGLHPTTVEAMSRQRMWRVEPWAEAARVACGGEPIPEAVRAMLIDHAPRSPMIAVALAARLGWSPRLADNVLSSAYGDVAALLNALRDAHAWGEMIADMMQRTTWTADDIRLVNELTSVLREGDSAIIAQALDESPRAAGVAALHPCILAAYLRRHPRLADHATYRAAWASAMLGDVAVDDRAVDLEVMDSVAATAPWSALTTLQSGYISGGGVETAAADPDAALLYLLWGGADLQSHETTLLIAGISVGPPTIIQEAARHGIDVQHVKPRRTRR